jgi:hypothetical protein
MRREMMIEMGASETEATTGNTNSDTDTGTVIPEIALLAAQIGEAIGFSFEDAELPATSEFLNSDGAWEYHFETDDRWGFVAAAPDEFVETTYPGWNVVTVEPGNWAVFFEGTFAGIVSPRGGRISGHDLLDWDEDTDLATAMLDAFRTERDALTDRNHDQTPRRPE